jgi:hypothetical protein
MHAHVAGLASTKHLQQLLCITAHSHFDMAHLLQWLKPLKLVSHQHWKIAAVAAPAIAWLHSGASRQAEPQSTATFASCAHLSHMHVGLDNGHSLACCGQHLSPGVRQLAAAASCRLLTAAMRNAQQQATDIKPKRNGRTPGQRLRAACNLTTARLEVRQSLVRAADKGCLASAASHTCNCWRQNCVTLPYASCATYGWGVVSLLYLLACALQYRYQFNI